MSVTNEVVTRVKLEQTGDAPGKLKDTAESVKTLDQVVASTSKAMQASLQPYISELEKVRQKYGEIGDASRKIVGNKPGGLGSFGAQGADAGRGANSQADKLLDGMNKLFGGKGTNIVGGDGASTDGKGGLGLLGKAGGALAAGFMVAKAAESASKIMEIANNGSLTEGQKSRKVGESLPIIGPLVKTLQDFVRAVEGTNEKLRRIDYGRESAAASNRPPLNIVQAAENAARARKKNVAFMVEDKDRGLFDPIGLNSIDGKGGGFFRKSRQIEGLHEYRGVEARGRAELDEPRAFADALRKVKPLEAKALDRGDWQQNIAYQEQQRRLPLHDAQDVAQARAKAAKEAMFGAQTRRNVLEDEQKRLLKVRDTADKRMKTAVVNDDGSSKAEERKMDAIRGAQLANLMVEKNRQRMEEATGDIRAKNLRLVEAENAAKQAGLNLARNELATLQEKEQRVASQAQTLGRMNIVERQMALQAAQQANRGGFQSLLPQQKAMLDRLNPQKFAKMAEAQGEKFAENKQLQDLGWFEKNNGLKAIRKQVDQVNANVRLDIRINEQAVADAVINGLKRVFDEQIADVVQKFKDQQKADAAARQAQRAAQ